MSMGFLFTVRLDGQVRLVRNWLIAPALYSMASEILHSSFPPGRRPLMAPMGRRPTSAFKCLGPSSSELRLFYHRIPSIRQLSPLPIPRNPTLSSGRKNALSSAIAAVIGSETVPMLPKCWKVVKSLDGGIPMALRIVCWWAAPT